MIPIFVSEVSYPFAKPAGSNSLCFSQTNKSPVFLGAVLSQVWAGATNPSQGARQPSRQKALQSHLAVSFRSYFRCNSSFVQPGADGESEHIWAGEKSSSSNVWSSELGSLLVVPPAWLCWPRVLCLLRWLQTEQRAGEAKWQMEAEAGSKQKASPPYNKH